jgi:riboflavin synthase
LTKTYELHALHGKQLHLAMFTGLIQQLGKLASREATGKGLRLTISAQKWDASLARGESIAVNGVCQTVARVTERGFACDVLEETARCSNLGTKQIGEVLNLERAIKLGEPLGGHLITGHVEGLGTLIRRSAVGRDWRLDFSCESPILRYIINKGSIACDGVSLTVASLEKGVFSVNIIPHTWQNTNLHLLKEGDTVNLETDLIGKYVFRYMEQQKASPAAKAMGDREVRNQRSEVRGRRSEVGDQKSEGNQSKPITEDLLRKAGFIQ